MMGSTTGYCRILAKVEMGLVKRNRPGVSTMTNRRHKKLLGQSTWFKVRREEKKGGQGRKKERVRNGEETVKEKDTREFQNVMFIPYTKGSELRKRLQDMEDSMKFRERVKYVEKRGPNLGAKLMRKDPLKMPCGRMNCLICEESPGVCMTPGAVYRWSCGHCEAMGKQAHYYGETSR